MRREDRKGGAEEEEAKVMHRRRQGRSVIKSTNKKRDRHGEERGGKVEEGVEK